MINYQPFPTEVISIAPPPDAQADPRTSLDRLRARFARNDGLPFADVLTEARVHDVLNEHGVRYRDRVFNPVTQGEKFDPSGSYVRRWVPELAGLPDRWLHAPWTAPPAVLAEAGVRLAHSLTGEPVESLREHAARLKQDAGAYLSAGEFLSRNTDGAGNPLTRVYSRRDARELFKDFSRVEFAVHFLNKRWLPVVGPLLPRSVESRLASRWGWHLWIYAEKGRK